MDPIQFKNELIVEDGKSFIARWACALLNSEHGGTVHNLPKLAGDTESVARVLNDVLVPPVHIEVVQDAADVAHAPGEVREGSQEEDVHEEGAHDDTAVVADPPARLTLRLHEDSLSIECAPHSRSAKRPFFAMKPSICGAGSMTHTDVVCTLRGWDRLRIDQVVLMDTPLVVVEVSEKDVTFGEEWMADSSIESSSHDFMKKHDLDEVALVISTKLPSMLHSLFTRGVDAPSPKLVFGVKDGKHAGGKPTVVGVPNVMTHGLGTFIVRDVANTIFPVFPTHHASIHVLLTRVLRRQSNTFIVSISTRWRTPEKGVPRLPASSVYARTFGPIDSPSTHRRATVTTTADSRRNPPMRHMDLADVYCTWFHKPTPPLLGSLFPAGRYLVVEDRVAAGAGAGAGDPEWQSLTFFDVVVDLMNDPTSPEIPKLNEHDSLDACLVVVYVRERGNFPLRAFAVLDRMVASNKQLHLFIISDTRTNVGFTTLARRYSSKAAVVDWALLEPVEAVRMLESLVAPLRQTEHDQQQAINSEYQVPSTPTAPPANDRATQIGAFLAARLPCPWWLCAELPRRNGWDAVTGRISLSIGEAADTEAVATCEFSQLVPVVGVTTALRCVAASFASLQEQHHVYWLDCARCPQIDDVLALVAASRSASDRTVDGTPTRSIVVFFDSVSDALWWRDLVHRCRVKFPDRAGGTPIVLVANLLSSPAAGHPITSVVSPLLDIERELPAIAKFWLDHLPDEDEHRKESVRRLVQYGSSRSEHDDPVRSLLWLGVTVKRGKFQPINSFIKRAFDTLSTPNLRSWLMGACLLRTLAEPADDDAAQPLSAPFAMNVSTLYDEDHALLLRVIDDLRPLLVRRGFGQYAVSHVLFANLLLRLLGLPLPPSSAERFDTFAECMRRMAWNPEGFVRSCRSLGLNYPRWLYVAMESVDVSSSSVLELVDYIVLRAKYTPSYAHALVLQARVHTKYARAAAKAHRTEDEKYHLSKAAKISRRAADSTTDRSVHHHAHIALLHLARWKMRNTPKQDGGVEAPAEWVEATEAVVSMLGDAPERADPATRRASERALQALIEMEKEVPDNLRRVLAYEPRRRTTSQSRSSPPPDWTKVVDWLGEDWLPYFPRRV